MPRHHQHLAHIFGCLHRSQTAAPSNSTTPSSAVPGEGIDLVSTKYETANGPLGSRTGSTALRVSLGASNGLVTSAHPLASMAGCRALIEGGNAFDAAAAIATVLNVVEPMSSGMAGNGFSTIYHADTGRVHSLAMTGAAPLAVRPDELSEADLSIGVKAPCTPGNIGGYLQMLERFGTMGCAETFRFAIEYAIGGHPVSEALAAAIRSQAEVLGRFPTSSKLFMPNGAPPCIGQTWCNPGLGRVMQRMVAAEKAALTRGCSRAEGIASASACFYTGEVAVEITDWLQREGGLLSLTDMAEHHPTEGWAAPLHTTYRGYDVYTNGQSTRGGLEVLMGLNILEGFDIAATGGPGAADLIHLQAEAIKVSKACIYEHVGDPAFHDTPYAGLVSKTYAEERRRLIKAAAAIKSTVAAGNPRPNTPQQLNVLKSSAAGTLQRSEQYYDSPDTTSFSVLDAKGNCVCCTPTIGEGFGTRVVVGETGLLFNNGMRIGSTSPYPENLNYVNPGQKALLNNSPLIVLKDDKLVLAMGTPGGEAIGQTQLQSIMNVLDFGLSIQESIEAPRFRLSASPNFYKPGAPIAMQLESRVSQSCVEKLEALGHAIQSTGPYSICAMQGILVDAATGNAAAGADPRGGYYAVGF